MSKAVFKYSPFILCSTLARFENFSVLEWSFSTFTLKDTLDGLYQKTLPQVLVQHFHLLESLREQVTTQAKNLRCREVNTVYQETHSENELGRLEFLY